MASLTRRDRVDIVTVSLTGPGGLPNGFIVIARTRVFAELAQPLGRYRVNFIHSQMYIRVAIIILLLLCFPNFLHILSLKYFYHIGT